MIRKFLLLTGSATVSWGFLLAGSASVAWFLDNFERCQHDCNCQLYHLMGDHRPSCSKNISHSRWHLRGQSE